MSSNEKKLVEVYKVPGETAAKIINSLGEYHIWVPESMAEEARKLVEGDEDV
jgi:hypothetical protein